VLAAGRSSRSGNSADFSPPRRGDAEVHSRLFGLRAARVWIPFHPSSGSSHWVASVFKGSEWLRDMPLWLRSSLLPPAVARTRSSRVTARSIASGGESRIRLPALRSAASSQARPRLSLVSGHGLGWRQGASSRTVSIRRLATGITTQIRKCTAQISVHPIPFYAAPQFACVVRRWVN
jgi:hypothetical protein